MVLRRKQLPRGGKRIISKTVDLLYGYGEKPGRIVSFAVIYTLIMAVIYMVTGIADGNTIIIYDGALELGENLKRLAICFYFSIVTFTTLGFGDYIPLMMAKPFAAFEAFSGAFIMALFVVVFVKKMTR